MPAQRRKWREKVRVRVRVRGRGRGRDRGRGRGRDRVCLPPSIWYALTPIQEMKIISD